MACCATASASRSRGLSGRTWASISGSWTRANASSASLRESRTPRRSAGASGTPSSTYSRTRRGTSGGGDVGFLVQGTLYPDVIESTSAKGGPSVTIKTHHNVGGLRPNLPWQLIEPLRELFKD